MSLVIASYIIGCIVIGLPFGIKTLWLVDRIRDDTWNDKSFLSSILFPFASRPIWGERSGMGTTFLLDFVGIDRRINDSNKDEKARRSTYILLTATLFWIPRIAYALVVGIPLFISKKL